MWCKDCVAGIEIEWREYLWSGIADGESVGGCL